MVGNIVAEEAKFDPFVIPNSLRWRSFHLRASKLYISSNPSLRTSYRFNFDQREKAETRRILRCHQVPASFSKICSPPYTICITMAVSLAISAAILGSGSVGRASLREDQISISSLLVLVPTTLPARRYVFSHSAVSAAGAFILKHMLYHWRTRRK